MAAQLIGAFVFFATILVFPAALPLVFIPGGDAVRGANARPIRYERDLESRARDRGDLTRR